MAFSRITHQENRFFLFSTYQTLSQYKLWSFWLSSSLRLHCSWRIPWI